MEKKHVKEKIQYYLVALFLLGISEVVFCQQDPQYTQYTYNMNVVNPAYAGLRESLKISILGKKQWVGVEGSPKTGTLSIHSPIGRKVGLGFSAIYDELGPIKETHLYADFSYTLRTSNTGKLALGLKGGFSFQNINPSLFRFNTNQSFDNDFQNKTSPNFGVGAYYFEENFYFGVSVPNILNTSFFETNLGSISKVSKNSAFFVTTGYVFDLNRELKFKPATMIRYAEGFPLSVDLSTSLFYKEKIEFGVSYRTAQSINFITRFYVNENIKIGYAYDYTVGNLATFNNGSHEILLLFDLPIGERVRRTLHCF